MIYVLSIFRAPCFSLFSLQVLCLILVLLVSRSQMEEEKIHGIQISQFYILEASTNSTIINKKYVVILLLFVRLYLCYVPQPLPIDNRQLPLGNFLPTLSIILEMIILSLSLQYTNIILYNAN